MLTIPCYMHVNYLENAGMSLAEICRHCAEAGYDGIELRDRDRSGEMSPQAYLETAVAAAEAAGVAFTFGCRVDTTSEDEALRAQAITHLKSVLACAGANQIRTINLFAGMIRAVEPMRSGEFQKFGSNVATEAQWQRTVTHMRQASDLAARHDITLCLETHMGYIHDLGRPTAMLIDRIDRPNVRANFDYGNIFLHPDHEGLDQELQLLKDRIAYVHLKNIVNLRQYGTLAWLAAPLRDGDINNFMLLRKLFASGYQGILTLENTMQGDKRHLVREDLEYLKSLLRDIASLDRSPEAKAEGISSPA